MAIETSEKYCPICGRALAEPTFNRFGEWACSEAHAEEYVKEVRAKRVQGVSSTAEQPRRARQMCGG